MENRIRSTFQDRPLKQRLVRKAALHKLNPVAQAKFREESTLRYFTSAETNNSSTVFAKAPHQPTTEEPRAACHENNALAPNCSRNHLFVRIWISLKLK